MVAPTLSFADFANHHMGHTSLSDKSDPRYIFQHHQQMHPVLDEEVFLFVRSIFRTDNRYFFHNIFILLVRWVIYQSMLYSQYLNVYLENYKTTYACHPQLCQVFSKTVVKTSQFVNM